MFIIGRIHEPPFFSYEDKTDFWCSSLVSKKAHAKEQGKWILQKHNELTFVDYVVQTSKQDKSPPFHPRLVCVHVKLTGTKWPKEKINQSNVIVLTPLFGYIREIPVDNLEEVILKFHKFGGESKTETEGSEMG